MKKYLFLSLLLVATMASRAQLNSSLFFMKTIQQNRQLNPALQTEFGFSLGSSVNLDYGNEGPSFGSTFQYTDNKISYPFKDNFDWKEFETSLNSKNSMSLLAHANLFNLSLKIKNWNFSISASEKVESKVDFSQHLITFLKNKSLNTFLDHIVEIAGLGLDAKAYSEVSFGISRKIGDKFSVGANFKSLSGLLNFNTTRTVFDIKKWSQDNNSVHIISDYNVQFSIPFLDIKRFEYDEAQQKMVVKTEDKDFSTAEYLFNSKNQGFGLDLGVTFQATKKLNLQLSVLDLGYIDWKAQSGEVGIKGEYIGKNIPYNDVVVLGDGAAHTLIDSVITEMLNSFKPVYHENGYKTNLNSKLYFGASYEINKLISVGALYHAIFFKDEIFHAGSLSANLKLNRWFELSTSYSATENSFNNIGVGMVIKAAVFQFFIMSDNIMAVIEPDKSHYTNLKMGLNITFGGKDKKEKRNTEPILK